MTCVTFYSPHGRPATFQYISYTVLVLLLMSGSFKPACERRLQLVLSLVLHMVSISEQPGIGLGVLSVFILFQTLNVISYALNSGISSFFLRISQ